MSHGNYRDKLGNEIDETEWRVVKKDHENNGTKDTTITKNGYEIKVYKMFYGNRQKLFGVYTQCSSDVEKYFNYSKDFQGNNDADTEFDRVVDAINNDLEIFEVN